MITRSNVICDYCNHLISGSKKHSHYAVLKDGYWSVISYHAPCHKYLSKEQLQELSNEVSIL